MRADVGRFFSRHPSDVSEVAAAIDSGILDPQTIVAIMGKTEGNGGRNDFTRDLATMAFQQLLRPYFVNSDRLSRIIFSFSGGCEGVITPHWIVITVAKTPASKAEGKKSLAIAVGKTRRFRSEEVGHMAMIDETSRVVENLRKEARISRASDVHFVHVKGAIVSPYGDQVRDNMAYSRGASALGVALALHEVAPDTITDDTVLRDWQYFSSVASTSAKPGLAYSEIVVMGNSSEWDGDLSISHTVMQDIIDAASLRDLWRKNSRGKEPQSIRAIFAKADADPRHVIRGRRHTMWTDDDIADMRYARCVVGGVIASVFADTAIYVSTRAEHHGPRGGGPVAIVGQRKDEEGHVNDQ